MPPDRITVVIPTYNERENLPDIADAVIRHGYRLLVVDDASPDGTGSIADQLAAAEPMISVLHRHRKEGLGPAYGAGFDLALDQGAEILIQMDADFSHDPADLPRLVEAIGAGADVAIGSRYVPGGSTPDWPLPRRLISKGGNLYARLMLGLPLRDVTAGYRAYRDEALRVLPYREARASGYGFQVEMALRTHGAGMRVVEVPITFRDRTRGTSKMGIGIVVEALGLVTLWGWQRFKRMVGSWRR